MNRVRNKVLLVAALLAVAAVVVVYYRQMEKQRHTVMDGTFVYLEERVTEEMVG